MPSDRDGRLGTSLAQQQEALPALWGGLIYSFFRHKTRRKKQKKKEYGAMSDWWLVVTPQRETFKPDDVLSGEGPKTIRRLRQAGGEVTIGLRRSTETRIQSTEVGRNHVFILMRDEHIEGKRFEVHNASETKRTICVNGAARTVLPAERFELGAGTTIGLATVEGRRVYVVTIEFAPITVETITISDTESEDDSVEVIDIAHAV